MAVNYLTRNFSLNTYNDDSDSDYDSFDEYTNDIDKICIEADNLIDHKHIRQSSISVKLKKILITLNSCKCCKRHQKNKPSLIDIERGHKGDYHYSKTNKKNICECKCRHMSRWIARKLNY